MKHFGKLANMLSIISPAGYSSVEDIDEEELKLEADSSRRSKHVLINTGPCSIFLITVLFLSSIVSTWILVFNTRLSLLHTSPSPASYGPSWVCQRPRTRREWRTLSEPERLDYVAAVKCLATKPSKLRNNGTLYDDFPWVHKELSSNTHVSAPFLPWHRYYIYLYEKALKEECSFNSDIPYWDWSLDWSNFQAAPIWDDKFGFGGDGSGLRSVGHGKCVASGPFSNLEVMFFDGEVEPHCLSRGFPKEEELKELGELIRPEAIDQLMGEERYDNFAGELEKRAHRFLSHSVRGDMSRFTGPNDPVFFLHHVNLDRLWWQWQQIERESRLTAYSGKANNNTEAAAALTDLLDMDGLSRNMRIVDVMDTNAGQFCYGY